MNSLPKLSILFLTCNRTEFALLTLQSTMKNLLYPKDLVTFYIADDGSSPEHFKAVKECIESNGFGIIGYHNKKIRHEGQEDTYNAGLGWNLGLGICHQNTDYVLVLEDDWNLDEPFEITPYINLLRENEKVGLCSFRILSVEADVHTVGYNSEIYLRYDSTTQYAYSGNPHIRHARYTKHYGWFAEDRNPGLVELHQDDLYRYREIEDGKMLLREENDGSPQIWRPYEINQWGAWKHIGSEKTWK